MRNKGVEPKVNLCKEGKGLLSTAIGDLSRVIDLAHFQRVVSGVQGTIHTCRGHNGEQVSLGPFVTSCRAAAARVRPGKKQ